MIFLNVDKAVAGYRQDPLNRRVDRACQECDECGVCVGASEALLDW